MQIKGETGKIFLMKLPITQLAATSTLESPLQTGGFPYISRTSAMMESTIFRHPPLNGRNSI